MKTINDQFGNISGSDADRIHRLITEDIPNRVAADRSYQNAQKNLDRQNARIEHDKLFKQFMDNEGFKRWLTDTIFGLTYQRPGQVARR